MRSILAAFASAVLFASRCAAQTYSNCNPLTQGGCPPDSALGKSVKIDFSSASDSFTPQGNPTYDSNGVTFAVAKSGDSPQLTSKWYIMFGKVDVTLKAAPGAGIVSSFVMQSDCLDEIDWEWLGADPDEVQTNYFGKGQTTTYNRGAFHADSGSQSGFKTYTIEWTASQIVWQINGQTVRVLNAQNAEAGQYPQTPMQIKVGAWSGGDSSNSQGTVQWARGPTDYSKGPFKMQVKAISVSDYSTGSQYKYNGNGGTWQDISAVGGSVNQGKSSAGSAAPPVTSVSSGQPIPFQGTRCDENEKTCTTPSVYPWVPMATTMSTATASYSTYPGLPSGWTVTDSGKVRPPSSAPSTSLSAESTSLPASWQQDSSSLPPGYNLITAPSVPQSTSTVGAVQPSAYAGSQNATGFALVRRPSVSPPVPSVQVQTVNGSSRIAFMWSFFMVTAASSIILLV